MVVGNDDYYWSLAHDEGARRKPEEAWNDVSAEVDLAE